MQTDDVYLIEEMLLRLNEAESRGDIARRNTMGGPMVKAVKEISSHNFFKNNILFSSSNQYDGVSAKLLFLEHTLAKYNKIISTTRLYIDNFIAAYYKLVDLNPKAHANRVKEILEQMCGVFTKKDTLLADQEAAIIYYLLFRSALTQGKLNSITRQKLLAFKKLVSDNWDVAELDINKADFDLTEFERLSHLRTNDACSIKERIKVLTDYFEIDNLYQ